MSPTSGPKVVALYFPQLHRIPENDEWWGDGFTDWDNVNKAAPLFDNHYQPRVPSDGCYDQAEAATLRRQAEQARSHGVHAFCFYHYWFDGHVLLDTPPRNLLEASDIDMPFCLSWANETWSRRWDGQDHEILIKQTHPVDVDRWRMHFDYLLPFWSDPRALRIDDKPVFVIYRPQNIGAIDEMLDHWRDWALESGLPGLHFMFQKQYQLADETPLNKFDSCFQFQPFESMDRSTAHIETPKKPLPLRVIRRLLREIGIPRQKPTLHDYDEVWETILDRPYTHERMVVHPGAFVDWDNTPRYGNRATIFAGASPAKFEKWLGRLFESEQGSVAELVFINAWNEWAEGAYLEPDSRHGDAYLQALKRVTSAGS